MDQAKEVIAGVSLLGIYYGVINKTGETGYGGIGF